MKLGLLGWFEGEASGSSAPSALVMGVLWVQVYSI